MGRYKRNKIPKHKKINRKMRRLAKDFFRISGWGLEKTLKSVAEESRAALQTWKEEEINLLRMFPKGGL